MTSLPAVPHSLPPLARLARSRRAPSSPPPGRSPPRSLAARPLARPPGLLGVGDAPAPPSRPGPPGPQPRAPGGPMPAGGRADPRSAGGTDGAPARGPRSVAVRPQGRRTCHPRPCRRRRRDAPARAARQPASRFPLLSRPPPPAAARRSPCQAVSLLFSSLSLPPPAPLPLQPVGGTGTS